MNFLKLFNQKPLIAAHRGANSIAPENTLLSMQKSIGHCDFIEIDVQLSSDGVAVIMHDETLQRTTNVEKLEVYKNRFPYNVCDFSFDELNGLDYGDGETLLTLTKALEFIKENSLYLNVEIKDVNEKFSDEQMVSTVLDEIKKFEVQDQVLISSFRAEYLPLVKKLSPNVPTAFLEDVSHKNNLVKYLKSLKVDAYNINKTLVEKDMIKTLKAKGILVGVYVVNDKEEQKKLFDVGVNAIFSDTCAT